MTKNEKMLLIAIVLYGISGIISKIILQTTTQTTYVWVRFLLAAIVITIIYIKKIRKINLKALKYAVALGIISYIGMYLEFWAIKITDISKLYFIIAIETIAIPILAYLIYKQRMAKKEWIGAIVAFIGLILINLKGASLVFGLGEVVAILCMFFYSYKIVLMARHNKNFEIIPVTIYMMYTIAFLGFIHDITESGFEFYIGQESFLFIGISIVFMTIIPFLLELYAYKNISPAKAGIMYAFIPIVAALSAMIILGEFMSIEGYIGSGIIFAALMIATINWRKYK